MIGVDDYYMVDEHIMSSIAAHADGILVHFIVNAYDEEFTLADGRLLP